MQVKISLISKTLYGSSKQGWMSLDWKTQKRDDIVELLDTIIEVIPPALHMEGSASNADIILRL